jgi:hypothetical protein
MFKLVYISAPANELIKQMTKVKPENLQKYLNENIVFRHLADAQ